MSLIDRYVYAVAQQLPLDRRDDIARELKANILDRLEAFAEEHGRPTTPVDESAVLRDLGHPQQVAAGYLPARTLVSQLWFPLYKQYLNYGLIFVVVAQLIILGVGFISQGEIRISQFFGGCIHAGLIAFAVITGIFYLLSNLPSVANIPPYGCWNPEHLPQVQSPWQRIKPWSCAMDFTNNLFALLVLQHGAWLSQDLLDKLPVKFGAGLTPWLLPLSLITLATIGLNLWNLRFNYWTKSKLIINASLSFCSCLIVASLSQSPQTLLIFTHLPPAFTLNFFDKLMHWVFLGIAVALLFETLRNLYRLYLLQRSGN